MIRATILAIGKARGADAELCAEYLKRLGKDVTVKDGATDTAARENEWLLKNIPPRAYVIVLDERGQDLASRELAAKLETAQTQGELVFIICGADGVSDAVREKARFLLGFGRLTWPHRLVRVMLLEQIYRATQILKGHPYHRD